MTRLVRLMSITAIAAGLSCTPALAQQVEGDARTVLTQWGRMMAEPGTFWLDSNEDREVIRYTTPRDVRLCLPRPQGVGAAGRGYPLLVTWDQTNTVTLFPGNCLFFDAKRVSVRPATNLPSGVTLQGHVETQSALQG